MAECITTILTQLSGGDDSAARRLLPIVYGELHRLAEGYLRHERAGHTLQPTALVHEAYLKLVDQTTVTWNDRSHFLGVAARSMRQVLIDYARKRGAVKRGGDQQRISLGDSLGVTSHDVLDLIAVDEALTRLAELDERQGRVVELRFFGGLTVQEVACVLNVSLSTVESDWRMARAWLHRELGEGPRP